MIKYLKIIELTPQLQDYIKNNNTVKSISKSLSSLGIDKNKLIDNINNLKLEGVSEQTTYFKHKKDLFTQKELDFSYGFVVVMLVLIHDLDRIPSEQEYCEEWLNLNLENICSEYNKVPNEIIDGLNYRIKLAYAGLIREFITMKMLSQNGLKIFYNPFLDVALKCDCVVKHNKKIYPIAIYLNSYYSKLQINRKRSSSYFDGDLIEIAVNMSSDGTRIAIPEEDYIKNISELIKSNNISSLQKINY